MKYSDRYNSTDIVQVAIEKAKNRFPNGNYLVSYVSKKEELSKYRDYFDCILIINVLEHIKEDVKILKNSIFCLRLGGYLFIFVPSIQALYCDLNKYASYYKRYSKKYFKEIQNQLSLNIVNIEYIKPLGAIDWF